MVTRDSMLAVQGVLLLSGYNRLPRKNMYWEANPDCHNDLVSENVRRDTFDGVMEALHFTDNMEMTEDQQEADRFVKVRPLFDNINKQCKTYLPDRRGKSVDEIMVPYYGPHGDKQFIKGKPFRY